ncbi:hypothetical protein IKS57_03060, partial [bacterium]|nr:hypothetical protein [bacterium]
TGSTSSNKLALNANMIQAGFTNFAVVILANGVRVGLLKTSITYSHNAPITNTSISFTGIDVKNNENYVYPSQNNDFSSIKVGFDFNSSTTNKTAIISYYGFNSTTNSYMTNNENPGFTLLGTQKISSVSATNNSDSFSLSANDSYYQEYYATITVGNYQYTTSKIINNILTNSAAVPSSTSSSSTSKPKSSTSSSNNKPTSPVKSSSTISGTTSKPKTSQTTPQPVAKPKVIIPTVTEKLNALDTSELLSQNNISSLSSYYSDYSSSSFENNLIKDLLSTSNVSITNITYNESEITSITFKNNTSSNIIID